VEKEALGHQDRKRSKERPEEGWGITAKGKKDKEQDRLSEKDRDREQDKVILKREKGEMEAG